MPAWLGLEENLVLRAVYYERLTVKNILSWTYYNILDILSSSVSNISCRRRQYINNIEEFLNGWQGSEKKTQKVFASRNVKKKCWT